MQLTRGRRIFAGANAVVSVNRSVETNARPYVQTPGAKRYITALHKPTP
jgi:hypothetical protein